ncbi:hypothetical protein GOP47_0002090 [Adiantum capillus-veneris]|uniref:Uncharacterized protein n=1 Tax=Adiantum capillus-veneris TaxID=13818 RepID=A0A9D4VBE4_ADICA|nr:hypothetical protein GOP47_0002090 [Adiantum capillus-veneris]
MVELALPHYFQDHKRLWQLQAGSFYPCLGIATPIGLEFVPMLRHSHRNLHMRCLGSIVTRFCFFKNLIPCRGMCS